MVNVFAAYFFLGRQLAFGQLFSACVGDGVDNGIGVVPLSLYERRAVVEQVL